MSSTVSWSTVFHIIRPSVKGKALMRSTLLARRGLYLRTEHLKLSWSEATVR
jgi:hypothetical protein